MKNIILLLLFCPLLFHGQNCKFLKNETDEFTGHKILKTNLEVLSYGYGQQEVVRVQALKVDDFRFLELWIVLTDIFSIEKDAKFMLLTEEGSHNFTLNFSEYQVAEPSYSTYTTSWYINTRIQLTEIEYLSLKVLDFKKLRVYTSKGYVEHDIHAKRKGNIKKVMNCI